MFTGIIQAVGTAKSVRKNNDTLRMAVSVPKNWRLQKGQSIAVDGVCLTIVRISGRCAEFDLIPETLRVTKFGKFVPKRVNLEFPLSLNAPIGGHLLTGHVDTTGNVLSREKTAESELLQVGFPNTYNRFVVTKGSVAIDGVSLTLAGSGKGWLSVALIPHTLSHTTLGDIEKGCLVNLEFDIFAKYALGITKS